MYHDDHPPPHIHVEYQGHEALVCINDGTVLKGYLPKKAARLVSDWCGDHKTALFDNWQKAVELQPLERIPGADYD